MKNLYKHFLTFVFSLMFISSNAIAGGHKYRSDLSGQKVVTQVHG